MLARARALLPALREQGAQIEAGRRLTAEAVKMLVDVGVFRLLAPRDAGGLEASPRTFVDVIEALSIGDSAAGWCAMVGASTSVAGGYLEPAVAREVFGGPQSTACGVFAPMGRGVAEGEGYRVTGRWPFASGCEHAAYRLGGFLVASPGEGGMQMRQALFRAEDTQIIDTWTTSGLRGTGSHDIAVEAAFVPASHTLSLTGEPRVATALYRFPVFGLLALGVAGVSMGIARAALDAFAELAASKRPMGAKRTLAERELVQTEVARAEAALRGARALVHAALEEVSAAVAGGAPMALKDRASLRLAATHATEEATRAVDIVQRAAGGSAVYEANAFARHHRDAHVATQHGMVAPSTYTVVGRVLLGLPTDEAGL